MRPSWYLLIFLTLLVVVVPLASSSADTGGSPSGGPRHNDSATYLPLVANNRDTALGDPIFGVQMYGNTGVTSVYHPFLLQSGASWLRVPISWEQTEPVRTDPPTYDWNAVDSFLSASVVDGQSPRLIVTVGNNPDWASPYLNGPLDPAALDAFAGFVQALVERYDGDGIDDADGSPLIRDWEFYNEPDALIGAGGEPHWGGAGAQYAQMLSHVYPAVKSAHLSARVLMGGLAYDWFEDQGGHFDRHFLDDVLDAGGGIYFDVMNFHVYPVFWYNWAADESPGLLEKTAHIRTLLAAYGFEDKPVLITEAGWHSSDHDPPLASDPERQARFVVELFTQSLAARLDTMIWWMLYDPSPPYPYMNGLVTNSEDPNPLQPKPSFQAYQVAVDLLSTVHFQRRLPLSETGTEAMEAYEFRDNMNSRTIYVAWLDPVDNPAIVPLRLPATLVTVHDIYGEVHYVWDELDGQLDGYVTVDVGGQPVYVEVAW